MLMNTVYAGSAVMTEEKKATYAKIQSYLKIQQITPKQVKKIQKAEMKNKTKNENFLEITQICINAFNPEYANKAIDFTMEAFMDEFKTSSIREKVAKLREESRNKAKGKTGLNWMKKAKAAYDKFRRKKKAEAQEAKPPERSSGKRNLFR